MQPEEIEANASVHVVVKHSSFKFCDPDGRFVFIDHFSHWPAFVKDSTLSEGLIVAPEDRARLGDAFYRRAKAYCLRVQADLEYQMIRRSRM